MFVNNIQSAAAACTKHVDQMHHAAPSAGGWKLEVIPLVASQRNEPERKWTLLNRVISTSECLKRKEVGTAAPLH